MRFDNVSEIVDRPVGNGVFTLQDRRTPLLWACYKSKLNLVQLLIDHGADSTVRDKVSERISLCIGSV